MLLLDIFKRKKKLEPLFNKCWQRIGDDIIYPAIVEEEPIQKLVFYGQLTYAVIFESALAVGMEPDTGHYLARLKVGQYKLGDGVTRAVEETFSGYETEDAANYADFIRDRAQSMVAKISAGDGEVTTLLEELAAGYRPIKFD